MIKKFLKSDTAVKVSFIADAVILLSGFLSVYIPLRDFPSVVLEFDSFGIHLIGTKLDLVKIALFGAAMIAVNFVLARTLLARAPFMARLTSCITFFISILIFYSFMAILSAN